MDLSKYVNEVQEQVARATSLADESTQEVAQKLGAALEPVLRLALIEAVADAAAEISEAMAGDVHVSMEGLKPTFTVSDGAADDEDDDQGALDDLLAGSGSDEELARISLRVPASVKQRIDQLAAAEGLSANAWLTHAVLARIVRAQRRGPGGSGFPGGPGFGPGFGRGRGRRRGGPGGRRGPEGFGPGCPPPPGAAGREWLEHREPGQDGPDPE